MMIRAQQALHLQGLEPVAETRADPHSYGFRRNRGTQDAIEYAFGLLAQKGAAPWILEGDILGCLDASSQYTSSYFSSVKKAGSGRRYLNS
jgi:RNA-directed DNA polymerase